MSRVWVSDTVFKSTNAIQNHSSISYSASLTPPTNHILTLVKPFSFIWYVIPLLETGAFDSTRALFQLVDDEKHEKKPA